MSVAFPQKDTPARTVRKHNRIKRVYRHHQRLPVRTTCPGKGVRCGPADPSAGVLSRACIGACPLLKYSSAGASRTHWGRERAGRQFMGWMVRVGWAARRRSSGGFVHHDFVSTYVIKQHCRPDGTYTRYARGDICMHQACTLNSTIQ